MRVAVQSPGDCRDIFVDANKCAIPRSVRGYSRCLVSSATALPGSSTQQGWTHMPRRHAVPGGGATRALGRVWLGKRRAGGACTSRAGHVRGLRGPPLAAAVRQKWTVAFSRLVLGSRLTCLSPFLPCGVVSLPLSWRQVGRNQLCKRGL